MRGAFAGKYMLRAREAMRGTGGRQRVTTSVYTVTGTGVPPNGTQFCAPQAARRPAQRTTGADALRYYVMFGIDRGCLHRRTCSLRLRLRVDDRAVRPPLDPTPLRGLAPEEARHGMGNYHVVACARMPACMRTKRRRCAQVTARQPES